MIPSDGALMSMFGPMLEIGPRVLLAMACGLLALAAVRICARAIRHRCAGVFLVGWALVQIPTKSPADSEMMSPGDTR